MSSGDKIHSLLDHLSIPETEADVVAWLEALPNTQKPHVVSFVNAHAVNLMIKDEGLFQALAQSETLLRDGSGMKVLMKWLGREPGQNMNGTDLIPRIVEVFCSKEQNTKSKKTIAVFGTQEPWLTSGCEAISRRGGNVVSQLDGFQNEAIYVEALKQTPVDLLILAMGMPKQEKVSMALRNAIDTPCTIINGGAYIDFVAGRVKRAPLAWRKLGVEWLYRLIQEPSRLFGRYVVGNVIFMMRALMLRMNKSNTQIT